LENREKLEAYNAARRIPQSTKDRILAAVREFNYQPNPLARALRTGQSVMASGDTRENASSTAAIQARTPRRRFT